MAESQWLSYCSFDTAIWAPSHLPCKQTLAKFLSSPKALFPTKLADSLLALLHKATFYT